MFLYSDKLSTVDDLNDEPTLFLIFMGFIRQFDG